MSRETVLIVEDDLTLRETLAEHLGERFQVLQADSLASANRQLDSNRVDVIILDLALPDGNGLEILRRLRAGVEAQVIVVTAFPKVQTAVKALKSGVFDYVNKPFELEQLELAIEKALRHQRLSEEVETLRRQSVRGGGVERLLGVSPAIVRVREEIQQVASTPDTTVLIRGESGTGKELVVEAIHHESGRSARELVRMNCSSIPASMMEAELFGHEQGAFTGARASRRGLIELADGGTLFLDEIGDLPVELQPKLLRVLENRRLRRVGGNREIKVDVRFVTATNRDLASMAAEGSFRSDLLYRINVFGIHVPPLRDRREDIPVLARYFLSELARHLGRDVVAFTEAAERSLRHYQWPGNARELRNAIERATIVCRGREIEASCLAYGVGSEDAVVDRAGPFADMDVGQFPSLADMERNYVEHVYRAAGENKSRAAAILGITRVTLRQKLRDPVSDPPIKN